MDGNPGRTIKKKRIKHRFFVYPSRVEFSGREIPHVTIDHDTAHHIRNVLRLQAGSMVSIFDGSGREYEAEVTQSKPSGVKVKVSRVTSPAVESPIKINLAQSLIKGNGFDKILTSCTELGCARFTPLFTSRTAARLSKTAAADKVKRWEKIAAEAAAQCGRVKVPVVDMPLDFEDFLEKRDESNGIILWEKGGSGQLAQIREETQKNLPFVLLAGPEGGFSQAEVKMAMDAGFHIWGLGPRKLRAETAGATAISVLQFILGDMG